MYNKRKNPKPRKKREPEVYNAAQLQKMAGAAQEIAKGTEPLQLDREIRNLKKRGWLRDGLDVADAIRFARRSLVTAVDRGQAEQQAPSSQRDARDQWTSLSDAAKKAVKSLDSLTKRSKFTIKGLQVLCTKKNLVNSVSSKSITAALRAVQSEASQLHSSIIDARLAADTIANQANAMAKGVAKRKHAPGAAFRRGFTIEMMKTWWLLFGRSPSQKRSWKKNPFADFADAALQAIYPDSVVPSCAGVVRSALPIFRNLQNSGAFDGVLDELTADKLIAQRDVNYLHELLSKETDENRRMTLSRLLAEAEENFRRRKRKG
jgi:hypothetical protein